MITGSNGPIFTKFLPYGRYLIVDYGFDLFIRSLKGRCHDNQF